MEDENEKCISDLSNLEKNIDKLKMENAELKSKVVEDLNYLVLVSFLTHLILG